MLHPRHSATKTIVMSDPVLVYKGDELASYGFGDPHPFGLDRHGVFQDELAAANLGDRIEYSTPRRASVDDLLLFHTADYIDKVSRMSVEGKGYLDEGDTPAMLGIFDAASDVVGTVIAAVDAIMRGEARRAFVPIAGLHHAGRNNAGGFCVFNDLGVAAEYLRKKYGIQRIAYVDIDAHHGDGMFYAFEGDADLIFVAEQGLHALVETDIFFETSCREGSEPDDIEHRASHGDEGLAQDSFFFSRRFRFSKGHRKVS